MTDTELIAQFNKGIESLKGILTTLQHREWFARSPLKEAESHLEHAAEKIQEWDDKFEKDAA